MSDFALWGPGAEYRGGISPSGRSSVNSACAILGCFLVLRRMSMLGDAISHAVLPGIVLAYLFAGRDAVVTLFLVRHARRRTHGACSCKRSTASAAWRKTRDWGSCSLRSSASAWCLVSNYASRAHIDVNRVLFGDMDFVSLDRFYWGPFDVPRSGRRRCSCELGAVIVFVTVFWKELKIASFDPLAGHGHGYYSRLPYITC